jgi:vacuolar protein sorting-associated protein 33A
VQPPLTLVFFIGGCTHAEIAAVRWLGRNESPPRDYLIATTHVINGASLMESCISACEPRLKRLDRETK